MPLISACLFETTFVMPSDAGADLFLTRLRELGIFGSVSGAVAI